MIIDSNQEKVLLGALDKRSSGKGLKNSELSLLHSYDRARQHGESVMVKPMSSLGGSKTGAKANVPMEDVENLSSKLRRLGTSDSSIEGDPISVVGSDGLLNKVPKHSTWVAPTDYPTKLGQSDYPFYFETNLNGAVFKNLNNSMMVTINASDLTKNMTIREIDVCDSGTPKKMKIIASVPY